MSPTKKIAILADFPVHLIPKSGFRTPAGHYATWLPQLALQFEKVDEFVFHWLTLDCFVEKPLRLEAWNQAFHVLPAWRRGRATTLFWADRHRIQSLLGRVQPDLVHGWGNENIWGWAAIASGRPNIFSVQGLLGLYGRMGHQGWRDRLMGLIEKRVLRKAQVITTESPWARDQIQRQTGRKDIRLIEYGIADRFFEMEPCPDSKHPYAVMVGTADHRKGIDLAVQLFGRPALRGHELRVIGGVSPFGEKWKRISSPNVTWCGRKSQAETASILAAARCLILPTRADVCANVVKEARVMGVPVVASPHGGHTQYIENGKNGFLCLLDDLEIWEKALLRIFREPGISSTMGGFLRKEHRALLHAERTGQAFLALYRELITGSTEPKA